jgi:ABC-type transport system involved in cytochrome bd biosynthesis fused ATPase/permease subunit
MYDRLGIHWGSSISAFLAAACLPFPWIFYKYGPVIRRHCRYAAESARQLDAMTDRMRAQNEQKTAGEKSTEQSAQAASSASATTNEEVNSPQKNDMA